MEGSIVSGGLSERATAGIDHADHGSGADPAILYLTAARSSRTAAAAGRADTDDACRRRTRTEWFPGPDLQRDILVAYLSVSRMNIIPLLTLGGSKGGLIAQQTTWSGKD